MEKIAMGLLSFMPEEKEVKKLQETMKQYIEDDTQMLYLWKQNEDMIGAIGLQIIESEKRVVIQHISVNPSHRDTGIGHAMIHAISLKFEDSYQIEANETTEAFFNKCK